MEAVIWSFSWKFLSVTWKQTMDIFPCWKAKSKTFLSMNISICLFGIIPRSPGALSIQESINKQEFAVKLQKNVKKGNLRAERMFIRYPKKLRKIDDCHLKVTIENYTFLESGSKCKGYNPNWFNVSFFINMIWYIWYTQTLSKKYF